MSHAYAHTVRSYALGQLKLLPVLCLFYHKKVTAWFMHLFSELDGNCLCFGAPDPIETWNMKMKFCSCMDLQGWAGIKLPDREQLDKYMLCVCVRLCIRVCNNVFPPVVPVWGCSIGSGQRIMCKPTFALTKLNIKSSHSMIFACVCDPLDNVIHKSACVPIFVWPCTLYSIVHQMLASVLMWRVCWKHVFFNKALTGERHRWVLTS